MCTSPIKRKNPSKDPLAKEYIYTPCGKCLSCQKTKQDGIEYRALKEYDWTMAHGGQVYFITFTYDDAHLPHVIAAPAFTRIGSKSVGVDTSYPVSPYRWFNKMSCFDKQDIQKFNKRLRSRLKYYNFHVDISFLIVSEYGSDREYISSIGELRKATQRPHYHAIYFITPSQREWTKKRSKPNEHLPSKTTFLNMSYDCWKMCQPYCFKEYLIDNKPLSAISYTAKYITKQQSDEIFSRNLPKQHPSVFLMETDDVVFDGHNFVKKYEEVSSDRIMPFSTVSNNFGCKHLLGRSVEELSSLMSHHTSITNQNGSIYSIPFPSYYIKKFLYVSQKSVEYVPAPIDIQSFPLRTRFHTETDYYLQEHVTTKVHTAHFEQHLANQYHVIENNYAKLCAVWYETENKPFSEDFLKSCLKDYLACKCAKVDYFCGTGEIVESPKTLEHLVFDAYYKDRTPEQRAKLLNSLECFITMVQVERNYQTRSKLIIQKDKQNKRSAQVNQSINLRHAHQFKASAFQRHKERFKNRV